MPGAECLSQVRRIDAGLSTGAFQCRFLFRIRLVPAVILQVAHVNARFSIMDGKPRPMSCVRLSGVHARVRAQQSGNENRWLSPPDDQVEYQADAVNEAGFVGLCCCGIGV